MKIFWLYKTRWKYLHKYINPVIIQIDHPNVVKLYEIYEDDKLFYMVLELMTGGEVTYLCENSYLRGLSKRTISVKGKQLKL